MSGRSGRDLAARRAEYSYSEVAGWPASWRREVTAKVQGLPVQVRTQGLMVTLAMLMGDDTESGRRLAGLLARWLLSESPQPVFTADRAVAAALLAACAKSTRGEYSAAQREAMLLLEQVHEYPDGQLAVYWGPHRLGDYGADGTLLQPEPGIVQRVATSP